MEGDKEASAPDVGAAGEKGSPLLAGRTVIALVLLGAVLIVASVFFGYVYVIGILVGLSEPRQPTGPEQALFASYALFGFLLLATGIASLRCNTRRHLWGLGAFAAAAAATLALCFFLEPRADRAACEKFIAKQIARQKEYGGSIAVDPSCLAKA